MIGRVVLRDNLVMDRIVGLNLHNDPRSIRGDHRMSKQHAVGAEECTGHGRKVYQGQITSLVSLHVAVSILKPVQHASTHDGNQGVRSDLNISNDVSRAEIVHGGNGTRR